jgi:hypothetical protein
MKVAIDIKITILDGVEKGRVFTEKRTGETTQEYTEYGTIEKLVLKWNYIHNRKPMKYVGEDGDTNETDN